MRLIAGVLLMLLGMGTMGSALLLMIWVRVALDRAAATRGAAWRFDSPLLVAAGVAAITMGTMTLCFNRGVVIWATGAPPAGVLALQLFAQLSLVTGVTTLLWVAGIGKRLWALVAFLVGSSAWAAVVLFWTLGYVRPS